MNLVDIENVNGSLILSNDSIFNHEDIELQPMNNSNRISGRSTPSQWHGLHTPPDCCPKMIMKHFAVCGRCISKRVQRRWTYLRSQAHRLVEHRFFEWLIIGSILASSTTLVSRFFVFYST